MMAKATDKSTPTRRSERDEWFSAYWAAAAPHQRDVLRDIVEQLKAGKAINEIDFARFRRRFGKASPYLRAVLDEVEYRHAVRRQQESR